MKRALPFLATFIVLAAACGDRIPQQPGVTIPTPGPSPTPTSTPTSATTGTPVPPTATPMRWGCNPPAGMGVRSVMLELSFDGSMATLDSHDYQRTQQMDGNYTVYRGSGQEQIELDSSLMNHGTHGSIKFGSITYSCDQV